MKKKMIFGAAVCMIAALSVVGMKANETASSDITLDGLVMTSVVNAECVKPQNYSKDGICVGIGAQRHCVYNRGHRQCDPDRR